VRTPFDVWPTPRSGAALVYDQLNYRLLAFGGRTSEGVSDEMWAFDLETKQWSKIAIGNLEGFPGLSYYSSVVDGDTWYIYGGLGATGNENVLLAWSFMNKEFMVLSDGSTGPSPRLGAALAIDSNNNQLLLFGGDGQNGGISGSALEGESHVESNPTGWFKSGTGYSHFADGVSYFTSSGAEELMYYASSPYMRDAKSIVMTTRLRLDNVNREGEYTGSLFGIFSDVEIPFAFVEKGGARYVVLVEDTDYLIQSGDVPDDWAAIEVDWSSYHEYGVTVDGESQIVTLEANGVSVSVSLESLGDLGSLAPQSGGYPTHYGFVGIGAGMLAADFDEDSASTIEVDYLRWRWHGEGEYLNDTWSYDLASGSWSLLLALCLGADDCTTSTAYSAARYYNPEPGHLAIVGGIGPPGEAVPALRSLNPAAPGAGFIVHDVTGSLPRSDGDCDSDGRIEADFGRLCTAGVNWWDPIGAVFCSPDDDSTTCSAASAAADILASIRFRPGVNAFDVSESEIFVATKTGVVVVDITNPQQPSKTMFIPLGRVLDIKVNGDLILVGHRWGFGVISRRTGRILDWSYADRNVKSVDTNGDIAVFVGKKYVNIVDISSPESIQSIARAGAKIVKKGRAIKMISDRILVATDKRGLHMLRVDRDAESVAEIGFTETSRAIDSMKIVGSAVYAIDKKGHPVFIDITSFEHPVVSGSHSLGSYSAGTKHHGGLVLGMTDRRTIGIARVIE